jgi:hypothetical protein
MEVRVREVVRIPTALTLAARRIWLFAEDGFREPQREALLAYTARPVQEEAGRKAPFAPRFEQSTS